MKKYLLALSLLGVFASFTQAATACKEHTDCKAGEYCEVDGKCHVMETR